MKAKAYIEITIDTDNPIQYGGPRAASGNLSHFNPKINAWESKIAIGNDVSKTNADVLSVTAHELGHLLARMFHLPAEQNAPENNPMVRLGFIAPDNSLKVAQESEAWEVAELMGIPIDAKTREFGLRSYQHPGMTWAQQGKITRS